MADVDEYYRPPGGAAAPPTVDEDDALRAAAAHVVFGSVGQRAGARMIDAFVGMAIGFVIGLARGVASHLLSHPGPKPGLHPGVLFIGAVFAVLYHAIAESVGGATVGKWMCGLRVRHERLGKCSFGAAVGRNLGVYVDYLFCGLVGINAIQSSSWRQRCGDRWAHTVVIVAKSAPPLRSTNLQNGLVFGLAALIAGMVLESLAQWA